MKSVVFDLDGTLADTSADLIASANACFADLGLGTPLDPVADALTAFAGGRAMLGLGFERLGVSDTSAISREFPNLLAHYARDLDVHTRLYDGVEACLQGLLKQGYALGVCTNKPAGLAEDLLVRLGIRDYFSAMLGADSLPVRKPDPEHLWATIDAMGGTRGCGVLIGDTITDRKAAQNAGLPCILVGFGPLGAGVADMKPAAVLDHYTDLEAMLGPIFDDLEKV
ncbi:phosphoglycolate phosphatase [Amylibacter marinus]|uniref:phosphoglycolate phosphatase n=1 Tax=Amylibacter marinus TaxID=1475483 RepID=A0ABQ5VUE4_9RHOB|nr:HAD-IA family hydrolase [Amylibacter marinus]GLQ34791.1 phosphoglycolate phosphatase [Amylibacter marinus]